MATLNTTNVIADFGWVHITSHADNSSTRIMLGDGSSSVTVKASVELDSNGDLKLWVNGGPGPLQGYPTAFSINGTTVSDGSVIVPNDAINLLLSDGSTAHSFTVGSGWITGGSSGGPNTLSGGTSQEIKDIHMYKLSDTSVSYSFNWQNVNSAYVWVNNAMHTISLGGAGNSGHHSSTLTGLTDGDIIIISNTDFKYIHRFVEWSKLTWGNTTSVVAETFGETGFEFRIQNTLGENSQYVSYQNSNQFAITANQTSSKKVYWQVWKHRASPFHMSKHGERFSTGSSSLHRNFW